MAKAPRNPYGGSNIPSQAPSRLIPYSPAIQPDIQATADMRGAKPIGFPPSGSFTLSIFDAELPQALRVTKPFRVESGQRIFSDGRQEGISGNIAEFVQVVPQARTFLMKEFQFCVNFPQDDGEFAGLMDAWGFPDSGLFDALPRFSILLNRAPVGEFGDLEAIDMLTSPQSYSSYVLVPGGQELTFQFLLQNQDDATSSFQMFGTLFGSYMLTKGVSLPEEPVNTDAMPTRDGGLDRFTLGNRGTKE